MEPTSRSLNVSFRGDGAGSYPLTWSQRWMWRAVCLNAPNLHHLCITLTVPVSSGPDVDAALRAISALLARHQSLRTSFHIDEHGEPRQVVVGRGQTMVRIYDVGASGSSPEIVRRLAHGLASAPFTMSELSARFLVVTSNETPTHAIIAVSHLATDAWAARGIKDDLARIAANGESEQPERRIVQLSDRAAYERSPDGINHSDRSISYWREQISRFPTRDYLPARNVAEQPRFREVLMESEAVGAAAQLLSSQLRVGMPAVFVGLAAVLLSERSGDQRASFLLFCHNRFTPSTSAAPRLSPRQVAALDTLDLLLDQPGLALDMALGPGDLQLIDNFAILHARTAFHDPPGGPGRLLMRMWLAWPGSPELPGSFRGLYGATAAGSYRGGVWPEGTLQIGARLAAS